MAFDDFDSDLYPLVTAPKKKFSRTKTGDLGYGGCAPWTPAKSRLATGLSGSGRLCAIQKKSILGKLNKIRGKKHTMLCVTIYWPVLGARLEAAHPPKKKFE